MGGSQLPPATAGTATAISCRRLDERAAVIDVSGDFTAASEAPLMEAYAQCGGERLHFIALNFSGLEYMNSSGIGLLVTFLVRVHRHKQRLAAYGLSEHYRQIFELTRLDDAIAIYGDESAALAIART